VLGGPTASGKTALAIEWAKTLHCPILSADSRQVYKELKIGVARPSDLELSLVPHFFIASHSIHNPLNAGSYEREALELLSHLFQEHKYVVLCGGTGLYSKALIQGLDPMPPSNPALRKTLHDLLLQEGISALQAILKAEDPLYYEIAEIQNPQRLIRAIEITRYENKSNLSYKKNRTTQRPFQSHCFALNPPREKLYASINQRVDTMFDLGLENEVRSLHPFRDLNPLQTVGYTELFDYFEGKSTFSACVEKIKQNTRRYAKRQMTWFRQQPEFKLIDPNEALAINIKALLQE
jgi:tRNA dimethylallyltransferase